MNRNNASTLLQQIPHGAKILFATFPADGHVNPLTGLAVYLKDQGYDVRWYTSKTYQSKIEKLGIPFYAFDKALDITGDNVDEIFPGRKKMKSQVAKLNFDIINVFINRGPEYYEDVKAIQQNFPFDVMVADIMFTGIPFVTDLMKVPVVGVGIVPITKTSKDLPPAGLGLTPASNVFGKMKQGLLRFAAGNICLPNRIKSCGMCWAVTALLR